MNNNIKALLSSNWWRELKQEIENRIAEIEIEILTEANKPTPNIDVLRKKSCEREAHKEIIELPHSLIEDAQTIIEEEDK